MKSNLLLQLADHLEHGKLGHAVFDFRYINVINPDTDEAFKYELNKCGTNGCAMGEMPIIWPNKFRFDGGNIAEIGNPYRYLQSTVAEWFDITNTDVWYLFFPRPNPAVDDEDFDCYEYPRLTETATKEQVAAHIRNFVAKRTP